MRRELLTRSVARFALFCCFLHAVSFAQVSVLTQRNDPARDGLNANETALTLSSVSVGNFGKLFTLPADGYVHAQPLYVANVAIPGNGTHNVVYVATMHDSVFAYDADGLTTQALWTANLAVLGCPSGWTCSSVPTSRNFTTSTDIIPEVGILSTPVIDPATGTLYVVAKTKEVSGGTTNYFYRLHALDIATGAERSSSPVLIQGKVPGTGSPNSGGFVVFSPQYSLQRPGLALVGTGVYIAFGSAGDDSDWHGWLFGYDKSALAQIAAFSPTPNGTEGHGGVWMHGNGLVVDPAGNLYFSTGNGAFDGATNFGDSFLKLTTPGLTVADYFTPYNQQALDNVDLDVASGGLIILPDSAGTAQHPHIMIGCGKNGALYVIDRDNLGQFNSSNDNQIIQELLNVIGNVHVDPFQTNYVEVCYATPAYWQGHMYIGGIDDSLKEFNFSNGLLSTSAVSLSPTAFSYTGASPSVSANGAANGIVWAIEHAGPVNGQDNSGTTAILHAYDATNLSNELYNSAQVPSDAAGAPVKFTVPTIANGKVYVETQNSVVVYGLFGGLPQAAAPSFSPPGGNYSAPVTVTISETTAGTTVYYTTDGTTPTTSSNVYTSPITIAITTTLKAMAAGPGYRASSVTTATYAIATGGGIGFVQKQQVMTDGSSTSAAKAFGANVTAGDLIVVALTVGPTGRTFSCSDTLGNTYAQAATEAQPSDSHQSYVEYASSKSSGADTVTCTVSGAATIIAMGIHEYSGVTTLDKVHSAHGVGAAVDSGATATTTAANELLFANVGLSGSGTSVTPGSGYATRVVIVNGGGSLDTYTEDKVVSATGAYNATCTPNASNLWSAIIVTFK